MLKALRFLGWPLLVGLLLALLLIQRYPQWVGLPSNEVHLQQAPRYGIAQEGPVSYADAVSRAAPAVANLYTTKMVNKSSTTRCWKTRCSAVSSATTCPSSDAWSRAWVRQ